MSRIKIDVIDMKILDILQEIQHVAGDDCFLLKVRAKDSPHFNSFLHNVILKTEGVTDKRSIIVMDTNKESLSIPLEYIENEE